MAKKKKKSSGGKSSIAKDPLFKTMPKDIQDFLVFNEKIQNEDNEDKARKMEKALDEATKQADPYWKSILRVAQDEVVRGFDEAKGDYVSGKERLNRRMTELNDDLAYNKEQLGIDLQKELEQQSRAYADNLDATVNNLADAGLTFSSKRKVAEQRLAQNNADIVESAQRQYNRQMRNMQVGTARGLADANASMDDLTRGYNNQITTIGRNAEKYLGTSNLPTLNGYAGLGDITGGMYEDKVKDIDARKNSIYNSLVGGSLNF